LDFIVSVIVTKKEADARIRLGQQGFHHPPDEMVACEMLQETLEKSTADDDAVAHPSHYTWLPGIECFDVVKHFPFCLGAAIKYIWRAGRKADNSAVQDLRKAIANIEKQIELLESAE
jgi:hypothetical protein